MNIENFNFLKEEYKGIIEIYKVDENTLDFGHGMNRQDSFAI